MSNTIPSDTHSPGDSSHTTHHNDIADVLGLYAKALAQLAGTDSSSNSTNISAISTDVSNTDYKRKHRVCRTSDSSKRTNTTATSADSVLVINDLQAGRLYKFSMYLRYSGSVSSGFKFTFRNDSGTNSAWGGYVHYSSGGGSTILTERGNSTTLSIGVSSLNAIDYARIVGYQQTPGTLDGSGFTFEWAQASADTVNGAWVAAGSWLEAELME